jgi:F5/8 type C domain
MIMNAQAVPTPVNRPAGISTGWLWLGILVLGGLASRALRFWGHFGLWAHWDEVRLAVPALGILQGDFPVHQLGVEYMGAFPSYLLAPWFFVFGSSPLALDCFAYGAGLTLWGTGYLVARRFSGRRAAACYALLSAVPALLLNQWSLNGNLNYPLLLLLGNLLLLLTRSLFFGRRNLPVYWLSAGLLGGLGWWNNLLVLVYLIPLGVLALRTRLGFEKRFWFFPLGFMAGSLPMWLYELGHFPSARLATFRGGESSIGLADKGILLLSESFPRLLGFEPGKLGGPSQVLAAVFLILFGAYFLVSALRRDAGEMAWLLGLRSLPGAGRIILWGILASNLALVLFTPRGGEIGGTGIRYLLPLYSVLPVWMGEALERGLNRKKALAIGVLAGWLGFQSWINWQDTVGSVPPAERRWEALRRHTDPLRQWLEARGLRRIYLEEAPGITSYEFTFLTGGKIVAADPWREEYLPLAVLVDGADKPPWVRGRKPAGNGRLTRGITGTLRALGWQPEVEEVGPFEVVRYKGEAAQGYEAVSRQEWTLTAQPNPTTAEYLADRDATSGWTTNGPQEPGQWITVDLGKRERLGRMDLAVPLWQDIPQDFRLEGSLDGSNWLSLAEVFDYIGPFFSAGPHPFLKVRRGRVQVVFPPRDLRYLRFVQQGKTGVRSWSANEIFLYRPAVRPAENPAPPKLLSILNREGVRFLYADPWLSARVNRLSNGAIRTVPSNLYVNSYGRIDPAPEVIASTVLQKGVALFLRKEAGGEETRALLSGQPAAWKAVPIEGGTLIIFGSGEERDRLIPRDDWQVTGIASEEKIEAVRDGKRKTGWKPDWTKGQGNLRIDLGRLRPIQRLRVDLEAPGGRIRPTISVSQDGIHWEGVPALTWSGPVYFDGWGLLRNGEKTWDVRFPSRRIRYLRLEFTPSDSPRTLEVQEINGYE